jgi:hypothetical protein
MYGPKIRMCTVAFILFICVLCYGGFLNLIYANGGSVVGDRNELIRLAKEIASDNKIDVTNCDLRLSEEGDFIVFEFWPKALDQVGGGGKLFFKKENGKYSFAKIELWQ